MGFFRFFAFLLLVAVTIGIGAAVYNAGVTAGLDEAARIAASAGDPLPVPAFGYGPYWHGPGGFGFFGFLFLIFGFFLIVGLARAAFGWGRWNGPRGPGGHGGGWAGRYDRMEELHRELHKRDTSSGDKPAGEQTAGA
jgi:hypothetical protein